MERLGFPLADPVYQRAVHAADAVNALRVFIEDIGKNAPAPPTTTGYLDDPDTAPGRRRARLTDRIGNDPRGIERRG